MTKLQLWNNELKNKQRKINKIGDIDTNLTLLEINNIYIYNHPLHFF